MTTVDELLGAPNRAQVAAASKFVGEFLSTTEALVALVAALRKMEAHEQAAIVESICEVMAELEAAIVESICEVMAELEVEEL